MIYLLAPLAMLAAYIVMAQIRIKQTGRTYKDVYNSFHITPFFVKAFVCTIVFLSAMADGYVASDYDPLALQVCAVVTSVVLWAWVARVFYAEVLLKAANLIRM